MIRFFDLFFSVFGLLLTLPLLLILILIGFFDTGSPLFIQKRIGKHKREFNLIKLRSMSIGTESMGSHMVNPKSVTRYGSFLRKSKLDELPQLFNVIKGDMSLVGPRPNLSSQHDLIKCRERLGVYNVRPGITGLAQLNNIDMSMPKKLAETDSYSIKNFNLKQYFKYIFMTILGKGYGDQVRK